jgi:hypothetical protein
MIRNAPRAARLTRNRLLPPIVFADAGVDDDRSASSQTCDGMTSEYRIAMP